MTDIKVGDREFALLARVRDLEKSRDYWKELFADLDDETFQLERARDRYRAALEGILSNVSLDWYVDQFARDTAPHGISSGAVNRIHNGEMIHRIKVCLEKARKALEEVEEWK